MVEATAKYNLAMNRAVYYLGPMRGFESFQNLLKPHYFLTLHSFDMIPEHHEEPYFVVACMDFDNKAKVHEVARRLTALEGPLAHKILYIEAPDFVATEQLLMAKELGSRYEAYGADKASHLKEYLKRVCVEDYKAGGIGALEKELAALFRTVDFGGVRSFIAKIKSSGAEGEETHRLIAIACEKIGEIPKMKYHLKQILAINRQNLWAANKLGRTLIKDGRVAEGIEVLERLSFFHELNGERLLTLGQAYVHAGDGQNAERVLRKGQQTIDTRDERFDQAIAQALILGGDYDGALASTGKDGYSEETIRFLNLRAVMASRKGNLKQALADYHQAIKGTRDKLIEAKLYFNLGLTSARAGDLEAAKKQLQASMVCGRNQFRRAEGPLQIVNTLLMRQRTPHAADEGALTMGDIDFETVF